VGDLRHLDAGAAVPASVGSPFAGHVLVDPEEADEGGDKPEDGGDEREDYDGLPLAAGVAGEGQVLRVQDGAATIADKLDEHAESGEPAERDDEVDASG